MKTTLQLTPGQVASFTLNANEALSGLLGGFTAKAALVSLGDTVLATVSDGVGIARTTRSDGTTGLLVSFSATQTTGVGLGARLVISLTSPSGTTLQASASLHATKNLYL